MIELIKKVLKDYPSIEWVIDEKVTSSYELFFVMRNLQMNRYKDVKHYEIVTYVDMDEFKGSATMRIHPTMNEEEIREVIEQSIYAAKFAKNKTFKLAEPKKLENIDTKSNMEGRELSDIALDIADAIFSEDKHKEGWLNATEIFVNRQSKRVVNSNGVDYSSASTTGAVEYITTWKGVKEEVELYRFIEFSNLDKKALIEDVKNQFLAAKYRSEALPMRSFENVNVVFRPSDINELLTYFVNRTNVISIYNRSSDWSVGSSVNEAKNGDKLRLTIDPFQVGSTTISPFDHDGYTNEKVSIIDNGIVKNLWGSSVYGQYIQYDSKVNNDNIEMGLGSLSDDELDSKPYLELVSLSGLQVDDVTGSFGSEIRLALYHEKGKVIPFYGGAITGFINQYSDTWKFSNKKAQINHYHGPKYLLIKGVNILGKE